MRRGVNLCGTFISFLFSIDQHKLKPGSAEIYLPTAREGNVFTRTCLSTIGVIDTGSLLGLVTAKSARILLEGFLVTARNEVGAR